MVNEGRLGKNGRNNLAARNNNALRRSEFSQNLTSNLSQAPNSVPPKVTESTNALLCDENQPNLRQTTRG